MFGGCLILAISVVIIFEFQYTYICRGGLVVRWCWVNFQGRSVLLIWISVGQGPTALAAGAGGGCLDIFLSSIISLYFLPLSLGDGPI